MAALPELGRIEGQKRRRPDDLEPKPKEETKQDQKSAALGGGGDGSLASTIAGPQLERSSGRSPNPSRLRERNRRPNAEALSFVVHVPKAAHLPNNGIFDGDMLFFSEHYQLAVLKIEVETMFEMEHPRYGAIPSYGDKVLVVARDEQLSLNLCHGTITWLEGEHFLFLDCKLCPCGIGGLVINDTGDVVGISFDDQDPAVLSSTTFRKCVEMWTKFGRVARPVLGMWLRSVFLLDIAHHERLRCKYGINNGFIVDEVVVDSTAEKHGVRKGNVITSFDGMSCSLPELEDFLLSVGMASLDGMERVNDFKLEVHDLLGQVKRTIILPVQLSD
ncbi:hypothetical protein EJB05_33338, partial [Eragrostis curvula]